MLRRQRAVLVEDADATLARSASFPVRPHSSPRRVVCHERPVGLIHADLGTTAQRPDRVRPRDGLGVRRGLRVRARALRAGRPAAPAVRAGRRAGPVDRGERRRAEPARDRARRSGRRRMAPHQLRAQPANGSRTTSPAASSRSSPCSRRARRTPDRAAADRLGGHGQDAREAHPPEARSAQPVASGFPVLPCPGRQDAPFEEAKSPLGSMRTRELADESGAVAKPSHRQLGTAPHGAAGARPVDQATVPLLSIVVPTKNERDNVAALVERLEAALPTVAMEIIFVDDSDDGTRELVEELAEDGHARARARCRQARAAADLRPRRRGRPGHARGARRRGSASWTPTCSTRPS